MPQESKEQSADEWTTVGKNKVKPPMYSNAVNDISRDMTAEKIASDFNLQTGAWKRSACRKQVIQILDRAHNDSERQIRKAVCIASGSFSRDNLENRRRTMWQFVAFMDVVRHLQSTEEETIEVFAQEPSFTPVDLEFLASLGIQHLAIPQSAQLSLGPTREHLGPESLLYEPFFEVIAETLRDMVEINPGLYIGSSMEGKLRRNDKASLAAESLAQRFLDEHRSCRFPYHDVDPHVFEGMSIYWKEKPETD